MQIWCFLNISGNDTSNEREFIPENDEHDIRWQNQLPWQGQTSMQHPVDSKSPVIKVQATEQSPQQNPSLSSRQNNEPDQTKVNDKTDAQDKLFKEILLNLLPEPHSAGLKIQTSERHSASWEDRTSEHQNPFPQEKLLNVNGVNSQEERIFPANRYDRYNQDITHHPYQVWSQTEGQSLAFYKRQNSQSLQGNNNRQYPSYLKSNCEGQDLSYVQGNYRRQYLPPIEGTLKGQNPSYVQGNYNGQYAPYMQYNYKGQYSAPMQGNFKVQYPSFYQGNNYNERYPTVFLDYHKGRYPTFQKRYFKRQYSRFPKGYYNGRYPLFSKFNDKGQYPLLRQDYYRGQYPLFPQSYYNIQPLLNQQTYFKVPLAFPYTIQGLGWMNQFSYMQPTMNYYAG